MMRKAQIYRKTAETDIELALFVDGTGKAEIDTGCGFLDHMLTLFAKHGKFDLTVRCVGDVNVDFHHTVEDVGICLGDAFKKALGDKKGIYRYGDCTLPMDESLILTALDLSGRTGLYYNLTVPAKRLGNFETELIEEFFLAFTRSAEMTIHIRQLAGRNSHHILEGAFKSFAKSMRKACEIDPRNPNEIPSSKGVL